MELDVEESIKKTQCHVFQIVKVFVCMAIMELEEMLAIKEIDEQS